MDLVRRTATPSARGAEPARWVAFDPATVTVPPADGTAEPEGFLVLVAPNDRIHFLDWGAGETREAGGGSGVGAAGTGGVLLVHGLSATAWTWTPVARRLRALRHTVAVDLRGHGLSDAPTAGYDPEGFVEDLLAVAEGSGLLSAPDDDGRGVILAGHGFGADHLRAPPTRAVAPPNRLT